MELLSLYAHRARFEIRSLLRDRNSVVFSMLLPVFLLVIFGSVFNSTKLSGTNVSFAQYFVAGLLASGLLYSSFQQLAIAIPEERSNGTLKRLVGSPMPPSVYFVGKLSARRSSTSFKRLPCSRLATTATTCNFPRVGPCGSISCGSVFSD